MTSDLPRPPYDPELVKVLGLIPIPHTLDAKFLNMVRSTPGLIPKVDLQAVIGSRPIRYHDVSVPGLNSGDPEVKLLVVTSTKTSGTPKPAFYYLHGGGMLMGDRFNGNEMMLQIVEENDAVAIGVEYRLAPEDPFPAGVNDCYAGLKWVAAHAEELGIDLERLIVGGSSGGGGLAAGMVLMARDRGGPKLKGQFLNYPMIDDRNITVSSHQFIAEGVWSRGSNEFAWSCILGDKAGTEDVSPYAAAARAEDLSGLPETFIDVGACEVFRDENVAYASRLWAAGVQAELHVYPGTYHGADALASTTQVGQRMRREQLRWMRAIMAKDDTVKDDTAVPGLKRAQGAL